MRTTRAWVWIGALIGLLGTDLCSAQIVYVDDDAPLGGDGRSWATAYRYLQDGFYDAQDDESVTEIRIAGGVYRPDEDEAGLVVPGDRDAGFVLLDRSFAIRGGFRGLAEAGDPNEQGAEFETVLTGEIGDPAVGTDNTIRLLTIGTDSSDGADVPSTPYQQRLERLGMRSAILGLGATGQASLDVDRCAIGPLAGNGFVSVQLGSFVGVEDTTRVRISESEIVGAVNIRAAEVDLRQVALAGSLGEGPSGWVSLRADFKEETLRITDCVFSDYSFVDLDAPFYVADTTFERVGWVTQFGLGRGGLFEDGEFIDCGQENALAVVDVDSVEIVRCLFKRCAGTRLLRNASVYGSEIIECQLSLGLGDGSRLDGTLVQDNEFGWMGRVGQIHATEFVRNAASAGLEIEGDAVTETIFRGNDVLGALVSGGRRSPVVITDSVFLDNVAESLLTDVDRIERTLATGNDLAEGAFVGVGSVVNCVVVGNDVSQDQWLVEASGQVVATTVAGNDLAGDVPRLIEASVVRGSVLSVPDARPVQLDAFFLSDTVLHASGIFAVDRFENIEFLAPVFVDELGPDGEPFTGDEDWTLAAGSPGIELAELGLLDGLSRTDLNGNPRFVDSTGDGVFRMDAGAIERQGGPAATCEAELLASGAGVAADSALTAGDLTRFVEQWVATSRFTDNTTAGANPGGEAWSEPDGVVSIEDLTRYVELWIGDCD